MKTPKHSDLKRIDKHPHYYVSPVSGKITYRRTHKGETIKIATGETQIGKAKEIVEVELERRRTGNSVKKIRRERKGVTNPSLDDVWDELIDHKSVGKEHSTVVNYWKSWNYGLKGFWSGKKVSDLTTENVRAFKKWYLKTNPKRLFEKTELHLGMLVRWAFEHRYIYEKPDLSDLKDVDEMIKKNKQYKKAGRVYTSAEMQAMYDASDSLPQDTLEQKILRNRIRLGIRLGRKCGMRKSEKCALRRDKINFKAKTMEVWSFKNHKWRTIPLLPDIAELIKEAIALNQNSVWVWPMPTDPTRHISSQIYDKQWVKVKENAGIVQSEENRARDHDLRHSFATQTAEENWPPKVACEILDMSLDEYDRTYAKPGIASKTALMMKSFGESDAT